MAQRRLISLTIAELEVEVQDGNHHLLMKLQHAIDNLPHSVDHHVLGEMHAQDAGLVSVGPM